MTADEIRKIAREEAEKVYNKLGTKYGVSQVPTHTHDNVSSTSIPPLSVGGFVALVSTTSGVANLGILGDQKLNNAYTSGRNNPSSAVCFPINTIYGFGVGVDSAFNGGEAENGTMIFFENSIALSNLWIKTINGWYGIDVDRVL